MTVNSSNPKFILFAQHGWADTNRNIARLMQTAANPGEMIITPSLGLVNTFIRIEPLVKQLEKIAREAINNYPVPIKIVGHSMGGLMWLEVLNRNPQWWERVHSFILLGSPVGGSNIARIIDPLGIGIGTAGDLGKNRRSMAEKIAKQIPTLSVASDNGRGTDGLVTVENTKFDYANWLSIFDIPHSAMRYHPDMIPILQDFWANPQLGVPPAADLSCRLIRRLRNIPGITDADYSNFERSQVIANFADGITLHTWENLLGVDHIYLVRQQQYLYAGYVGSLHSWGLRRVIKEIREIVL